MIARQPLILLAALASCSPTPPARALSEQSVQESAPEAETAVASPPQEEAEPSTEAPAEAAPSEQLVSLVVPGFAAAYVVTPAPSKAPRPVLIAAHGAGDDPRAQCITWQNVVQGRAFILCPTGVRLTSNPAVPSGYFYPDHFKLEREVLATLAALGEAYGNRVDTSRVVYTGYSQGATMGMLFALKRGAQFPRLIMVEGGSQDWNRAAARNYQRSGGERVLIVCGTAHCNQGAQKAVHWLTAEGAQARSEHVAGAGHVYGGAVLERVAENLDWVLSGDERWSSR